LLRFDSDGNRAYFEPGETVTVVVTALNRSSAECDRLPEIDSDDDPSTPSTYNSHDTGLYIPKNPFVSNSEQEFIYHRTIPDSAAAGQYYRSFSIRDEYHALGFRKTGWLPLFQVTSADCDPLTRSYSGAGTAPTASPKNSGGCYSGQYITGEFIELTAHPAAGYQVSGWSGTDDDDLTTTTNTVTMPAGPMKWGELRPPVLL
jgi:hypothetical protein